MRGQFEGRKTPATSKRASSKDHHFVLINTEGESFGRELTVPSKASRKEKRDAIKAYQRASNAAHAKATPRIKRVLIRYAVEANLPLTLHLYELSPHIIRGVMGYAIYLITGSFEKTAVFLGDTVNTAQKSYTAIDGRTVDSSITAHMEAIPIPGGRLSDVDDRKVSSQHKKGYHERLQELLDAQRQGLIDLDEFKAAKASLNAAHAA